MSEEVTSDAVASPLENKAVEILDASQKAIGEFADKMVELGKQYGPDVADAALQMARIDAIQFLVPGVVAAILCGLLILVGIKLARAVNADKFSADTAIPLFAFGGLCTVISAGFAIFRLVDVWAWVGIFEPKLWLAKRILGL